MINFCSNLSFGQEVPHEGLTQLYETKQALNIPEGTKCDTTIVNSKKYYSCPVGPNKKIFIASYTGREYIEDEGAKILFKTEKYLIVNDSSIANIHEQEYYHYIDEYSNKKEKRKWEACYTLYNGNVLNFYERSSGKDKRGDFSEDDILLTYQKHLKRIKDAQNNEH